MGDGMGKEREPEFWSKTCFAQWEHTPEWDLKLVSKSLSKDSCQPERSTVSLTARCRLPPTLRV